MIPELGNFALVLALVLALVQAAFPIAGAQTGRRAWMALARPAAAGQFVFVALAFGILAHAFLTDDFSVRFVAMNSNSALPTIYKFAAVWGGHEGSMLLWILILAIWTLAVAAASRAQPEAFASRVLGVLGIVSAGVIAFTLLTSNPFDRLLPAAFNGNDLNPLLQDPAMAAHPPMLYTGYVGMSVPFAFAVAALLSGRLDKDWARWTRPWTIMAWVFLTCGITLGSWWSYYELGWGGWWFWDPVENASFMPWLVGTALVHSLAVTERRGIFKSWTVLLAIAAFSLSLLGTFLTRSGVLISVHAFASDPRRGLFILGLLATISGGALTLYALRARRMIAEGGFRLLSREAFLLANNILLVIAAGAILFGTLYPLFIDALNLGKISVGPPYFNLVFLLPIFPMLYLLGVGMHTAWKKTNADFLKRRLIWPAAIAVVVGATLPWLLYGRVSVLTVVGTVAAVWVGATALLDPVARLLGGKGRVRVTRGQWGMIIAHFGLALFVLGVTVTSTYSVETDRSAVPGDRFPVGGYEFVFRGMRKVEGPNFTADEGEFELRKGGKLITVLTPQKRTYEVQTNPMTEAAIDAGIGRDVFVALGDPLGQTAGGQASWSLRVQIKPLISFLWIGALVMACGGIVSATDRRYRQPVRASEAGRVSAEPSAAQGA
jgi:cytochrome c-type biogenesis protein CcmF